MKKKLILIPILILALILIPVVPVMAADTLTVDTSIANTPPNYHTIQAAINAASSGDTINVAAGTYPENVVIPPGKNNLQLIGVGSGATSIAPASGRPVTSLGWLGFINDFTIKGFTLVTADASHAFLVGSGTANGTTYTTNLALEDIVVSGGQRGIGLNAVNGVTLTNVHLRNINGSPEAALELTGVFGLTFTQGSIIGNDIGVRLQPTGKGDIGAGYGPNGNIQIHSSSLLNNTVAIENQDSGITIDAINNWWSTTDGSAIQAMVSGNVLFDPWSSLVTGSKPKRNLNQFAVFMRLGWDGSRYVSKDDNTLKYSIEASGEYGDTQYMLMIPEGCTIEQPSGKRLKGFLLEEIDGDVLTFSPKNVEFSEPCTLYIAEGDRLFQDYWTGEWLGGKWVEVGTFTSIVDGEAVLE